MLDFIQGFRLRDLKLFTPRNESKIRDNQSVSAYVACEINLQQKITTDYVLIRWDRFYSAVTFLKVKCIELWREVARGSPLSLA